MIYAVVNMTKDQILKKAFKKAEENGYKITLPSNMDGELPMSKVIEYGIYYKFIFNHDFAKAFFTKEFKGGKMHITSEDTWDKHLQRMVVEKDPIKYLGKYL